MLSFLIFNSPKVQALFDKIPFEQALNEAIADDCYFLPMRGLVKTAEESIPDETYDIIAEYGDRNFSKIALFSGNTTDWAVKDNIFKVLRAKFGITDSDMELESWVSDYLNVNLDDINSFDALIGILDSETEELSGVLSNGWKWHQTLHINGSDGAGVLLYIIDTTNQVA